MLSIANDERSKLFPATVHRIIIEISTNSARTISDLSETFSEAHYRINKIADAAAMVNKKKKVRKKK